MSGPGRYTVLIIGCGKIAGGYDMARPAGALPHTHAGAFTRDGRFRIDACIDPDADQRARFAARWDVSHAVASISDLGAMRFDIVSIASPTALHAQHLEAAISLRPRLIFCEKPMTSLASETRHWIERAEAAGVLLAVNHTRRWAPDVVQLAAELRAGVHGAIRSATGWYTKGVLNNGSHMIDLLHILLGPVDVRGAGLEVYDFWIDDPTIPATLDAGGIPVHLSVGHASDFALFELEIVTEKSVLTMEHSGQSWRVRRAGDEHELTKSRTLDVDERVAGRYDEAMLAAVANIHDALTAGAPLASDGRSALEAQLVCESIRELSARTA